MATHWGEDSYSGRYRSERTQKRLQKTERDKRLIHLYKELNEVQKAQKHLGLTELQPPVQKGWKRYFVLRPDVQRSADAAFFLTLLEKVNTIDYSDRKDFKVKRRKFGKKTYEVKPQNIREFYNWEFQKLQLTVKEQLCFAQEWRLGHNGTSMYQVHVFIEPWRFALVVRPNIITHIKTIDPLLAQRKDEIDHYLERNHLWTRLHKILQGRGRYRNRWRYNNKAKYDDLKKEDRALKQESFSSEH